MCSRWYAGNSSQSTMRMDGSSSRSASQSVVASSSGRAKPVTVRHPSDVPRVLPNRRDRPSGLSSRSPERVRISILDQTRPHGVVPNILRHLVHVFLAAQHMVIEAPLPQRCPRSFFEPVSGCLFEPLHKRNQPRVLCPLEQHMKVIGHETVREDDEVMPLSGLAQLFFEQAHEVLSAKESGPALSVQGNHVRIRALV